ncbi:hypothetical protein RN001_004433 [Aquatica leii]|uniref:Uncharacterized protein n=1 Tax=Aquatica leii TaxID=1421715 RepID=A0AAN7SI17_9COLE|nr:hypothetical protein RN001_004433 [Aquatica leii]
MASEQMQELISINVTGNDIIAMAVRAAQVTNRTYSNSKIASPIPAFGENLDENVVDEKDDEMEEDLEGDAKIGNIIVEKMWEELPEGVEIVYNLKKNGQPSLYHRFSSSLNKYLWNFRKNSI